MLEARTSISGPIFDPSLGSVVAKRMNKVEQQVGDLLVEKVRNRLSQVLVNPTGHYRSKISSSTLQGSTLISDSGVVYGPWLEAGDTGTRFKGYATFRTVMQQAEGEAVALYESEASELVRELS